MSLQDRVRLYFRGKAKQLIALGEITICEHHSLSGGHREELQRIYLKEILPKRYEIGRGMVYGLVGKSKEADIIIWDSYDFPSLPLAGHAFYFVESVRCIVECKSNYSTDELSDVMVKCDAATNIMTVPGLGLKEELASIHQELMSLRQGVEHDGSLNVLPQIAFAAVFLCGGHTLDAKIAQRNLDEIHEKWPDILLFLEPGIVVLKEYEPTGGLGGVGRLRFYKPEEDSLLYFTHELLVRITERSETIAPPLKLLRYVQDLADLEAFDELEFPLFGPVVQRTPLWRKKPAQHKK